MTEGLARSDERTTGRSDERDARPSDDGPVPAVPVVPASEAPVSEGPVPQADVPASPPRAAAPRRRAPPAQRRRPHVVLLQGPTGPFFRRFSRRLVAAGLRSTRVVFNLADQVYAGRSRPFRRVVAFRKRPRRWEAWFEALVARDRPDLVVVFSCERAHHAAACRVCEREGVPVLALEAGYVRPGFVSAEWGGNNRFSPLRDATADEIALSQRVPAPVAFGETSTGAMIWLSGWYYVLRALGRGAFPNERHYRNRNVVLEAFFWARSFYRGVRRYFRNQDTIHRHMEHHTGRYTIVVCQVRDDTQLVHAGRGWTNETFVDAVIASFAAHAPRAHRLIVKVHPFERGHSGTMRFIRRTAERHGVADRVAGLDDGSIGLLTTTAHSMVTVNSSSAFSAMLRGVPVAVAGDAMFRRDDLVHVIDGADDLDGFWTRDMGKQTAAAALFRHHMMVSALVPGGFYHRTATTVAIEGLLGMVRTRLALDTGALDTGALDTGALDTGAPDTGASDAGPTGGPAGNTDAGPVGKPGRELGGGPVREPGGGGSAN